MDDRLVCLFLVKDILKMLIRKIILREHSQGCFIPKEETAVKKVVRDKLPSK